MDYTNVERRKVISEFPDYEITNFGRVINKRTGRVMVLSPTLSGIPTVGMMRDGRQYRRSVKVLVAKAFVPGETELFDTPVLLDNDKYNCNWDNIVWRPRWFAWEYTHQFENPPIWFHSGPVEDVVNHVEYDSIFIAAIVTGSLCRDIRRSIVNGLKVFPGGEQYVYSHNRRRA